ncbi:glycosyltransferase family 2 protein [Chelativorans alearense]|uniref:glycosyltransferase family 2 protein n=1 Tax=Chelativorans alearense TaxID=2681495 RepID=UPI0013D441E8|nr:glycosyltransferase family 2 protein [Chelativorans alearense]
MESGLISIVIPCKNEAANLPPLLDEIEVAMMGRRFEVVVVDDGSTDNTCEVLSTEAQVRKCTVRHIRHDRSAGKSLALRSGAFAARGGIVVMIDGDGQNDPQYILPLIDALLAGGPSTGIAAGQRLKRQDGALKRWASRFANWLRNGILKDDTRDTACGMKAIGTELLRKLPFFEGSHRFLPALVIQEGYGVVHHDVVDRPRLHGTSHYGILDRGYKGTLDLMGVWWLRSRRKNMPKVEEIVHG